MATLITDVENGFGSERADSSEPGRCAELLLDALPRVMWFVRRAMRREEQLELSIPQFRALAVLSAFHGAPLSLLAENLGSTMPNASRIVTGLVKKGFVRRSDVESDRRCLSLEITEQGERVLKVAKRATQRAVSEVLSKSSPEARQQISKASQVLGDLFDVTKVDLGPSKMKKRVETDDEFDAIGE